MNCYLLERPHANGVTYVCAIRLTTGDYDLSFDPHEAIRFARREDAERVLGGVDLRAVAHKFCDTQSQSVSQISAVMPT